MTKTMAAGVFKAKCLKVMDEVQAKRISVVITKRGKPVAKIVPIDAKPFDDLSVDILVRDDSQPAAGSAG